MPLLPLNKTDILYFLLLISFISMIVSILKVDKYSFLVSFSFCLLFPILILFMVFFVENKDNSRTCVENSINDVREIVTQLDEISGSVNALVTETIDIQYV